MSRASGDPLLDYIQSRLIRDRIRDAILRLPVPPDRQYKLEAFVFQIEMAGELFRHIDDPNANPAGTARAASALDQFAARALQLEADMDAMPKEAVDALDAELDAEASARWDLTDPSVRDADFALLYRLSRRRLHEKLRRYADCAGQAKARLDVDPTPRRLGRPRKNRALATARVALLAYEELTGILATGRVKQEPITGDLTGPKAYGPSHDFLAEVFNALSIKASAESQLKAVLAEKKAAKTTN